jgi:hypothetical protein
VRAHRVLRDEQAACDVVRPEVLVKQEENLELAGAQDVCDHLRNAGVAVTAGANLVEETPSGGAGQRGLPPCDRVQELDDAVRRLGLEQVSRRPAADGSEQVLLSLGGGEHNDLSCRSSLLESGQRLQSVDFGHRKVEQNQLRLQPPTGLDRLATVGRLAHHLEAVACKQRGESFPGERVIINDQDSRGHDPLIGGDAPAD